MNKFGFNQDGVLFRILVEDDELLVSMKPHGEPDADWMSVTLTRSVVRAMANLLD